MRKFLIPIFLLIPLTAQAQRFPYHAGIFFQECTHLAEARHGESSDEVTLDTGCARYIEGFEVGYIASAHLPETCLADPLTLFQQAASNYRRDTQPSDMPTQYLVDAIRKRCSQ